MRTIDIATAEGAPLDWLVAKYMDTLPLSFDDWRVTWPAYSTDGAYGQPLIEKFIPTLIKRDGIWSAECYSAGKNWFCFCLKGPTALIASMRAIVTAHQNGPTALVPEELFT